MKNKFVANGPFRFRRAQATVSLEILTKKYADQLATATPAQKQKIQEQIAEEFLRQKNHKPSAATLW